MWSLTCYQVTERRYATPIPPPSPWWNSGDHDRPLVDTDHVVTTALRRSFRAVDVPAAPTGERPRGVAASYRAGVVANVSNPKAAVLYLALFPQFLPPDGGSLADTAVLAGVQMSISASYYLLVVVAIDTVRRFLAKAAVRRLLDRLTGFVLVGLGVRMLTLSRAAV